MKTLLAYCQKDGTSPFLQFVSENKKVGQKLLQGVSCLASFPEFEKAPHSKYFSIAPYKGLYEFRVRIKVPVRTIYIKRDDQIILLHPFVKRHERNLIQALDKSLQYLRELRESEDQAILLKEL